ncbi:unnamed protein product [Dovyalis caffra]|uniref:Uncharacterized protein n=1 Tax=Dovyalis caffra TaxID=77055 RepID=A0AAV1RDF7_9ROSI|nr:unnamed protein product [Dovyalis caffra]
MQILYSAGRILESENSVLQNEIDHRLNNVLSRTSVSNIVSTDWPTRSPDDVCLNNGIPTTTTYRSEHLASSHLEHPPCEANLIAGIIVAGVDAQNENFHAMPLTFSQNENHRPNLPFLILDDEGDGKKTTAKVEGFATLMDSKEAFDANMQTLLNDGFVDTPNYVLI